MQEPCVSTLPPFRWPQLCRWPNRGTIISIPPCSRNRITSFTHSTVYTKACWLCDLTYYTHLYIDLTNCKYKHNTIIQLHFKNHSLLSRRVCQSSWDIFEKFYSVETFALKKADDFHKSIYSPLLQRARTSFLTTPNWLHLWSFFSLNSSLLDGPVPSNKELCQFF